MTTVFIATASDGDFYVDHQFAGVFSTAELAMEWLKKQPLEEQSLISIDEHILDWDGVTGQYSWVCTLFEGEGA